MQFYHKITRVYTEFSESSTPRVAPSWLLSLLSKICGSRSESTTNPDLPSSSASASPKPSTIIPTHNAGEKKNDLLNFPFLLTYKKKKKKLRNFVCSFCVNVFPASIPSYFSLCNVHPKVG